MTKRTGGRTLDYSYRCRLTLPSLQGRGGFRQCPCMTKRTGGRILVDQLRINGCDRIFIA
jgi:hypothetical protein